ncbi:uncharacterized protein LOC126842372 [Adelges cooleyi]|uniref:uncharacterized protein LOC126842372 n=1 Tax=Adelges cooleyi TaxID=133065 RepID=UPI00218068A5|nr:uncharacterized protein LOC126842372 [Adelges cooleyi]
MAFVKNTYCCTAVNRTLHAVVMDCVVKEMYAEAFIRFTNVIESEGISMLARICHISIKIIQKRNMGACILHINTIGPVIADIENKFKMFLISTAPVRQIIDAINVLRMKDVSLEERKEFYNNTCMEFSQRYGNMMGLVSTGKYADFGYISNTYRANQELEFILDRAKAYFKNESDAGPSAGPSGGGDELNAQNQFQIEDLSGQL